MRSLFKIFKKPTQSSLHMVNFPDYEYFNDVDIAYSDITPDKNKIAPFKETKIKNYFHDWFDGEILENIILRDKCEIFKASRLNIDEQLYKEPKINVQKLIKNKKKTFAKKN